MISGQSLRRLTTIALALWAVLLCWAAVRWALRPGLFPILDELSNPALFLDGSYHDYVHFFPVQFFGDRPLAWALVKLLADLCGFNYARQVLCFIAIHFANCGMAFVLFRRLGASLPIAIAGMGFFGSVWTSAQSATYTGEPGDVICLFFLLACTLVLLWERRGATVLSAVLFLAALRSKEFAIVFPMVLTVLVALRLPRMPLLQTLAAVARRLWMHYLIVVLFGLLYIPLYRVYRAGFASSSPYHMDLHPSAVMSSLGYYTALVFGADESRWQIPPVLLALALAAILCWALYRRRAGLAFGVCAYVLTLLPVCLISNRAPFYVYAPQAFLILALCLLVEDALALVAKSEPRRWVAAVCIAVLCFSWCVAFRRSAYFRDKMNWNYAVRGASMRTAHDVDASLPPMGPGSTVYVNHSADTTPWLFLAPCPYLQLVNHQRGITCVVDKPADQLLTLYGHDPGPKFLLDYHEDGSVTVASMNR